MSSIFNEFSHMNQFVRMWKSSRTVEWGKSFDKKDYFNCWAKWGSSAFVCSLTAYPFWLHLNLNLNLNNAYLFRMLWNWDLKQCMRCDGVQKNKNGLLMRKRERERKDIWIAWIAWDWITVDCSINHTYAMLNMNARSFLVLAIQM